MHATWRRLSPCEWVISRVRRSFFRLCVVTGFLHERTSEQLSKQAREREIKGERQSVGEREKERARKKKSAREKEMTRERKRVVGGKERERDRVSVLISGKCARRVRCKDWTAHFKICWREKRGLA
jgi:hypothetical protein